MVVKGLLYCMRVNIKGVLFVLVKNFMVCLSLELFMSNLLF